MKANQGLRKWHWVACARLAAQALSAAVVAAEPEPSPFGDPVKELERSTPLRGAMIFEAEEGFTKIFNGRDLTGWKGNPKLWSVKDGAITGVTTADPKLTHNTFLVWTNGTTEDFELRLSYRIIGGNSGIQYRSKVLDQGAFGPIVGGYQADFEAGKTYSGILYEERLTRGIMAERGEQVVWDKDCQKKVVGAIGNSDTIQAGIRPDDWNDYVIIAQGNRLRHFINGKPTVDVTDECEAKRALSGVLALQIHVGPPMTVQFKNVRIKSLSREAGAATEEIMKFHGIWEVTGGEVNGAAIATSDIPAMVVTIEGNTYRVSTATGTDRGSFSVSPAQQPKQMDLRPETGADTGRTVPAIYELGPDNLRVCYASPGGERPTVFATQPDSGRLLITYQRKKP